VVLFIFHTCGSTKIRKKGGGGEEENTSNLSHSPTSSDRDFRREEQGKKKGCSLRSRSFKTRLPAQPPRSPPTENKRSRRRGVQASARCMVCVMTKKKEGGEARPLVFFLGAARRVRSGRGGGKGDWHGLLLTPLACAAKIKNREERGGEGGREKVPR